MCGACSTQFPVVRNDATSDGGDTTAEGRIVRFSVSSKFDVSLSLSLTLSVGRAGRMVCVRHCSRWI